MGGVGVGWGVIVFGDGVLVYGDCVFEVVVE